MSITERLQAFSRHHLFRKTAILQIGGVGSTVIQALAGVFLARLLQPALYGRYALAFSVAAICSVFIGGSLTDAIAPALSRAWAQRDGRGLGAAIGFYLRFVGVCAVITAVLLVLLPFITAHLYHDSGIGSLADVIIIASAISVSVFALTQLSLQVAGKFPALAGLTLTDAVMRYGASLALVIAGLGVWGAVAGHLIGAMLMLAVAAVLYLWLERSNALVPRFRQFGKFMRRTTWHPFLKPTLWVLADSNFALLYGALPVAMIGLYVTGAPLAYFKLAFGYIMLGMGAMGPVSTVMNVHFPTVQTTAPERLRRTFVRVTWTAVGLSAAITAVVAVVAPLVFRLLYGAAYLPAVPYVYGFIPFGMFFGLGVGLGPMWRALGKVPVSILINVITLGIGIPAGLWCINMWGLWGAVAMTSFWYTASHIVSFWYLVSVLPKEEKFGTMKVHES